MEKEQFQQYPPKPELSTDKTTVPKFIFTLGMFGLLFFFLSGGSIDAVIMILIILMIHEFGHLTAMKLLNQRIESILIFPILGRISFPDEDSASQKKRVIILMSGPLPGILIGAGLMWYALGIQHDYLTLIASAFMMVNAFNLLPFDPLDGGKLLEALFTDSYDKIKLTFLIIVAATFTLATFYSTMLIVVSLLVGLRIYSMIRASKLRIELISELNVDLNKSYDEITDREYWEIRRYLLQQMPNGPINPDLLEPFDNEKVLVNQVKSIVRRPLQLDMNTGQKFCVFFLWLTGILVPLYILTSALTQINL
jgi:Zn-dependent protease